MKSSFVLAALVFAGTLHAQDIAPAFTKCAATVNDQVRLACYDKIRDQLPRSAAPGSSQVARYDSIQLADLKVDIKGMMGKKVAVAASIQSMGETSMLKSDPMDMTPIWADTEKLPREDRKKLANGCQMLLCSGRFYGTLSKGVFGPSLVVDRVEWK